MMSSLCLSPKGQRGGGVGIVWLSAAARKYKNAQEGAVCIWTRVRKLTFNLDKHRLESSCSRLISRFHMCVHETISTLSIPISSLWWESERRRAEPPPPPHHHRHYTRSLRVHLGNNTEGGQGTGQARPHHRQQRGGGAGS